MAALVVPIEFVGRKCRTVSLLAVTGVCFPMVVFLEAPAGHHIIARLGAKCQSEGGRCTEVKVFSSTGPLIMNVVAVCTHRGGAVGRWASTEASLQ